MRLLLIDNLFLKKFSFDPKRKDILAGIVLIVLPLLFMWKVWVLGQAAFPGDLLVGAYAPWMEKIPVKNPLISDVFSQIYSWKNLVVQSYKAGQWPLWNPYTLSGYPLMANFHSGGLYPMNVFLLLGTLNGWHIMLYLQLALSGVAIYLFLRILGNSLRSSLIAAIGYVFAGFPMAMWLVGYSGHALIWIPLALSAIELALRKDNLNWLWFIPALMFFILTAGHFQAAIYSIVIISSYFIFRFKFQKKLVLLVLLIISGMITAIQWLPTMELSRLSVRFDEGYIASQKYGLLPLNNLITGWVPDFFGNPVTRNYWGFYNYQETVWYVGLLGMISIVFAIFYRHKLGYLQKYFLILGLIILCLGFDTPLGRAIYYYKIPGLSTSSASRIFVLLPLPVSVLTAWFIDSKKDWNRRIVVKFSLVMVGTLIFAITSATYMQNWRIALRNLFYPGLLLVLIFVILRVYNKFPKAIYLLVLLSLIDLWKFGWKYNPFVDPKLVFPISPETNYLKSQSGFFRIDRENGPVFPPNIWEAYGLMSASGYDPLTPKIYSEKYHEQLNKIPGSTATRYTELSKYDALAMAEYGIRYLIIRPDKIDILNQLDWQVETKSAITYVLENKYFKGLAYFSPAGPGDVTIDSWGLNNINLHISSPVQATVKVASSYFPGWKVQVNKQPADFKLSNENFFLIDVPPGNTEITMTYAPQSFRIGSLISLAGAVLYLTFVTKGDPNRR